MTTAGKDLVVTFVPPAAKVPDFFFHRYQDKLNAKAEEYIEEVNRLYEAK